MTPLPEGNPGGGATGPNVGARGSGALGGTLAGIVGGGGVLCHRESAAGELGAAGSGPRGRESTKAPASTVSASAATPLPTQIRSCRDGASVVGSVVGSRPVPLSLPRAPRRTCDDEPPPPRKATVGPRVGKSGLMTGNRVPL